MASTEAWATIFIFLGLVLAYTFRIAPRGGLGKLLYMNEDVRFNIEMYDVKTFYFTRNLLIKNYLQPAQPEDDMRLIEVICF